jgi:hypothetical protein
MTEESPILNITLIKTFNAQKNDDHNITKKIHNNLVEQVKTYLTKGASSKAILQFGSNFVVWQWNLP